MKNSTPYLRRSQFISLVLGLALLTAIIIPLAFSAPRTAQPASAKPNAAPLTTAQARSAYGKMPMSFEANHGQTDHAVRFLSRGRGYTLFLTSAEAVFVMARQKGEQREAAVLRMRIDGADPQSGMLGLEQLPGIVNYFIGKDAEKWHTKIPTFARVHYASVYRGIDLIYYGNQQQLEYDFVVKPGADHKQIALRFEGASNLEVDRATGDLLIQVGGETIRQQKPSVYQEVNGTRKNIEAGYVLENGGRVGFAVSAYDSQRPLVIDPVLAYSTYLGGSSAESANAIAVDSSGQAYITGGFASPNFPVTPGAFDPTFNAGVLDTVVAKLNPAGSALIYSTYLGGTGSEIGSGIAIDSAGNAFVTGRTSSTDFPTVNPFSASYNGGAADAYVTKLNATGSALVYSSYLGGSGNDRARDVALHSSGAAYLTGHTDSANFPLVNATQAAYGGGTNDAFVTAMNAAGNALTYSTYLGGSADDQAQGIAVDASNAAYVIGFTASANFPTANATDSTFAGGGNDAFVTKLNAAGVFAFSTYLGGTGDEDGAAIALDSTNNVYLVGSTTSTDFPTLTPVQPANAGLRDFFVTKLNAAVPPALLYSTYFGGTGNEVSDILGLAVDGSGSAYATGQTASTNFPTVDPIQAAYGGGTFDAVVFKLNPAGSAAAYSTYLGGSAFDAGLAIAVDSVGNAYASGHTSSPNFPTAGPIQSTNSGSTDAYVVKIGDYSISGRVVDGSSNGISGVMVTLSGTDAGITSTDANGNFVFLDTTPGGSYTVTPSQAGFTFAPPSIIITNLSSNQELIFVASAVLATPTPTPTVAAQLQNVSTRARVGTGDNAEIGGFIISGGVPKKVILRAIGPSLVEKGLSGVLADPVLELRARNGVLLSRNLNWRDSQEAEIEATGLPPLRDAESAIVMTLAPEAYTGIVTGQGETSGIALVEVYDLESANSKLANVSTRGFVQTANNVMIGGFILGGGDGNKRVAVRALGPSLGSAGISNPLVDPTAELRDGEGTLLRSNDDWQADPQAAELIVVGLAPSDTRESGMVINLPPGAYTVIVAGKNASIGVGLVEVYALP